VFVDVFYQPLGPLPGRLRRQAFYAQGDQAAFLAFADAQVILPEGFCQVPVGGFLAFACEF